MITFSCPSCGNSLQVDDQQEGAEVRCSCGAVVVVPVEVACDYGPASTPDAQTITMEELEALKRELRGMPKP